MTAIRDKYCLIANDIYSRKKKKYSVDYFTISYSHVYIYITYIYFNLESKVKKLKYEIFYLALTIVFRLQK